MNSTLLKNPGPGSYNSPKASVTLDSSPSCGFGVSKRPDVDVELRRVPGPGVYKMPSSIGEGPKSSFAIRMTQGGIYTDTKVPGPGMYKLKSDMSSPKNFTIKGRYNFGTVLIANSDGTHEKVASSPDKDVPGPGSYHARHDLV